jgi:steroid 5-alpha reductase family enzyme
MIYIFLQVAGILFVYMSCVWAIAQIKKDNSIADIAWGLGFIIIALFTLIKTNLYLPIQLITTTLIIIWGLRLSLHVLIRNWGKKEDQRYQNMRISWGNHSHLYAYAQIFILQGIILLVISLPIILINSNSHNCKSSFNICFFLIIMGICLWIIGFIFESIGDKQLYTFLKDPANKGKIMKYGLWKYTRHPNYFGEIIMWWGIFIIALSNNFGFSAIISPLLITYLLNYISGVPLAEKPLEHISEYQAYKKKTNTLIPWFPKK